MANLYTSADLGPLTSIFTPPSACISTITYVPPISESGSPSLYRGASGNAIAKECYPEGFATDSVFSPGICPSGWTSACVPSQRDGGALYSDSTTGVQCCPSGMSCSIYNNAPDFAFCQQAPTGTLRVVWSLTTGAFGLDGSLVTTSFPSMEVLAKPIFVAYQDKDQALLASITAPPSLSSSSSSSTTTSSESTTTQTSEKESTTATTTTSASTGAATGTSQGLSTGVKAGIGIGAAVGALILIGATFLLLRMCGYRRQSSGGGATPVVPSYEEEKQVYPQGHVAPANVWNEDRGLQGQQGGGFQYRPSASEMDAGYGPAQLPELVERPR